MEVQLPVTQFSITSSLHIPLS